MLNVLLSLFISMFVGIFGYMMIDEIVEWKKEKKSLI